MKYELKHSKPEPPITVTLTMSRSEIIALRDELELMMGAGDEEPIPVVSELYEAFSEAARFRS